VAKDAFYHSMRLHSRECDSYFFLLAFPITHAACATKAWSAHRKFLHSHTFRPDLSSTL
jgi:hypothetical protein